MKHSNLYLGLVLPAGGWQSLIDVRKNFQWYAILSHCKKTSKRHKNYAGVFNSFCRLSICDPRSWTKLDKMENFLTNVDKLWLSFICGLYYKHIMIVNDASRVTSEYVTSL